METDNLLMKKRLVDISVVFKFNHVKTYLCKTREQKSLKFTQNIILRGVSLQSVCIQQRHYLRGDGYIDSVKFLSVTKSYPQKFSRGEPLT